MSGPPRLKAPREHGAILAEPPLAEVGALLALNRQRLERFSRPIFGQPFPEMRRFAGSEVPAAARAYLSRMGEPFASRIPTGSTLVAGHQPDLFHPGVWVKNFALCGLARAHSATPVNLIIDYDAVKSASLSVPRVRLPLPPVEEFRAHTEPVPFDHPPLGIPHEEWIVQDEELFATLPERARQDWGFTPLLDEFWHEVRQQVPRTRFMAERLTAARRAIERRWGCHNLEVPVSEVCSHGPFTYFLGDLLANLPYFHRIYNDCVHEYRRAHDLKSRNHPVPDLARDGDWLEAPFWAWRAGRTQRSRLMVRRTETGVDLRAGGEAWPAIMLWNEAGNHTISDLAGLAEQGLKVRPRALTNTLFFRLFVADLFVHGIGGGKYDELTDEIIRRYYGAEPPAYLVLSATLLLPFPTYPVESDDCRRLARQVRDLRCNPQRFLPGGLDPITADLLTQREEWVTRRPLERSERHRRWRVLRSLTEQLQPAVEPRRQEVLAQLARCKGREKANAVLRRRDLAFCLYPENELRLFCVSFLAPAEEQQ